MKGFKRNNQLLSLCGLNCGLCPMHIDGYCPGCGGGAGNQSCRIARCSLEHDNLTYCYECSSYPCDKYMKFAKYDSFITHQHYHQDLMKAKDGGIDTYNQEQLEKIDILKIFLEKYNDGRKKSFYCLAVNLLELEELKSLIKQIETNSKLSALTKKEHAKYVFDLFQDLAKQHSLILKLNKKSKK